MALTMSQAAVGGMRILTDEQVETIVSKLDVVSVFADVLQAMRIQQLMELAANVAADLIRDDKIKLDIGTDKIEQGMLDYNLVGDVELLDPVSEHMASKGVYDFEKDKQFHQVSAVITAAQMVAFDMDEKASESILEKGKNLQNLEPGTKDRAEKTQEFLDELFAFIAKRREAAPAVEAPKDDA